MFVCYIVVMRNTNIEVGDKVQHKENPNIQGVVVGSAFGKPASYNVRLHLTCGLTYDVTPYALKKVKEFAWQTAKCVVYYIMFDEDNNELDEVTRRLLNKVCAGVEIPSDEEVEETLDCQDS